MFYNLKETHMEEDDWWDNFFDDPCDDISGEQLHLWFEHVSMQVS